MAKNTINDLELLFEILRINRAYKRIRHSADEGMPDNPGIHGSGRLLHNLADHGEMPQKELAERLEIRPQSLTGILVKLEDAGYITRTRGVADKREQLVNITSEGRKYSRRIEKMRKEIAGRFFAVLTEEEKQTMSELLTKIWDSLEEENV